MEEVVVEFFENGTGEIKNGQQGEEKRVLPLMLFYERALTNESCILRSNERAFVKNRAVRAKEALDENTLQHNF